MNEIKKRLITREFDKIWKKFSTDYKLSPEIGFMHEGKFFTICGIGVCLLEEGGEALVFTTKECGKDDMDILEVHANQAD